MRARLSTLTLACLCAALLGAPAANAAVGAVPTVKTTWSDTNMSPGGEGLFVVQVRNVGDANFSEGLTITDQVPAGTHVTGVRWEGAGGKDLTSGCSGNGPGAPPGIEGATEVSCVLSKTAVEVSKVGQAPGTEGELGVENPQPSGFMLPIYVEVEVDPEATGSAANTATVEGGGASQPASDVDQISFSSTPAGFGIVPGSYEADFFDAVFPFGQTTRKAGDRPFELRTDFDLNAHSFVDPHGHLDGTPNGLLRTVEVTLPRGVIGNPEAVPKCDPTDFAERGSTGNGTACPSDTQVGYLNAVVSASARPSLSRVPIYNLEPPKGVLADLAFTAGGLVQGHIYSTLDPAHDYAIKTTTPDIVAIFAVTGGEVTIWGVPGDPAHDFFRFYTTKQENGDVAGAPFKAGIRPFLTNPMDCGFENGGTKIRLKSYEKPNAFTPSEEFGKHDNVSGCDDPRFRFEPNISLQPTNRDAGASTGLDVHLEVPQRNDEVTDATDLYAKNGKVKAIATPPIKKTVVTLPRGMTVNPAAAQGLQSCSPAQIGLGTNSPVACPDASQFGKLILHSPNLPADAQPEGFIYVAKQGENPFGNFLSLYLAIQEPERDLLVKIPGKVDLDPQTGQITTTFDDLPQFPVSDMQLNLKSGLRAGLVNPQTCGQKTITATFYSWQDPSTPHTVKNSYDIAHNPDGSPCHNSLSERPFNPLLSGGTVNPVAGAFSPLELAMTRTDEDQELSGAEGTAPPGLTASLKGITRCSDAAISAASDPNRTGSEEINSPSCPASSQVGSVDAGAGVGQVLTYVKGKVYLAGPYKGAPLSGVAIVPAVAGPFDLGVVVTRAPAYLNPETAQITLRTDPLPLIFKGVPVRVRDIRVHVDRSNFTLNPTSCEPMSLTGLLFSSEGKGKSSASPFQASDCASLGFRPQISLKLLGGTKRGAHPSLRAEVRPRAGDANIASASVTLPHSAFLDQAHIRTICTRVQFAANACPAGSVYGHAAAYTPLLDEPLEGPVYLRSSSHNLPDLVVALKGPPSLPIEFNLAGRVDSVKGGIRNTFEYAPDAPVSKFVLEMQGAKKGLVVNSTDLCAKANRAKANLSAHNGRAYSFKPVVKPDCGGGRKGKHKRRGHK